MNWMLRIVLLSSFTVTGLLFAQTDSLNVKWDPNPDPDMYQYRLYRAVNSTTNFYPFQSVLHPQTKTTDHQNIQPGSYYAYSVVAIDSAGNLSNFSDTVSVGIPLITWTQTNLTPGQATQLPLNSFLMDPDHAVSQLQLTIKNTNNVLVSITNGKLVLQPDPITYTGPANFNLTAMDPDSLFDQKLVSFYFGATTNQANEPVVPGQFQVFQNYPNPFNPTTEIRYQLPAISQVRISVYSILGQKVRTLVNTMQDAGSHSVYWDGRNDSGVEVGSGNYFYIVQAGQHQAVRKMLMLK